VLLATGGLALGFGDSAQAADLDGSWAGGGSVQFSSGSSEQARCRVSYSKRSSTSYAASATCATPSARVTQTAVLRRTGDNSFSGTFHNSEYNISGTIQVVMRGNAQSVHLSSSAASASLRLSR
jgi:hypothetical protein